jgi:aryl-alcohol dehydrogenase-like predicted oxidoreductase
VEGSLRRLGTDYIDIYQMHGFDPMTPVEETLGVLDDLVRDGKIRYIGCSNFSGWHLMKSLAVSEKYGLARYVAHQAYYSLIGREYEWELMPLGLDQKVGGIIWSPLGGARLTGKIRRGQPPPEVSRLHSKAVTDVGPQVDEEYFYRVTRWTRSRPRPERPYHKSLSAGGGRSRGGKDGAADCYQLAVAAADRVERHYRSSERGTITPEPELDRLESDP